jgi:hypothetical protein
MKHMGEIKDACTKSMKIYGQNIGAEYKQNIKSMKGV